MGKVKYGKVKYREISDEMLLIVDKHCAQRLLRKVVVLSQQILAKMLLEKKCLH